MHNEPVHLETPWREFLTEIDATLTAPVQLVCIGGFVVTAIYGLSRSTEDLDHLSSPGELTPELQVIAGKGSAFHRKFGLYIDRVGIVTMPIEFEERLCQLPLQFEKIKLFIPDIYDLVLSKLERNSPKDYFDIEYLATKEKLSFAILCQRFDDELDFIPNRERHINTLNLWKDWFQE